MVSLFGRGFDSLQLHKNRPPFGDLFLWSWRESGDLFLVHSVNGGPPGHLARILASPQYVRTCVGIGASEATSETAVLEIKKGRRKGDLSLFLVGLETSKSAKL